jgi:nitrogen fixation/metabolism regulation signal transduction histidine kinase
MTLDRLLAPGAFRMSLSALLEQVPVGVAVFDHTGRALLHNTAFTEIVGVVPGRVQELSSESPVARAFGGTAVMGETLELAPPGGSPRRVRVSALPLPGADAPSGVLVVAAPAVAATDDPAPDARGIFGVVAHDLRNPLAAIRMTAQLLGKPDEMPGERRVTLARRLLTSATRMDAIVRNLLDYARAAAGAVVRLEREPVDLSEVARRVVADQVQAHPGRAIDQRVIGDPAGYWDGGRLEQVLGHLVANAFLHGAETPVPVLAIDGSASDRVRLQVRNHGPVMSPDLLARAFQPFTIGPRPTGSPRRHIGLGLFVVHEMVTAHGGTVAASSSEAEGTELCVDLPRGRSGVTAA